MKITSTIVALAAGATLAGAQVAPPPTRPVRPTPVERTAPEVAPLPTRTPPTGLPWIVEAPLAPTSTVEWIVPGPLMAPLVEWPALGMEPIATLPPVEWIAPEPLVAPSVEWPSIMIEPPMPVEWPDALVAPAPLPSVTWTTPELPDAPAIWQGTPPRATSRPDAEQARLRAEERRMEQELSRLLMRDQAEWQRDQMRAQSELARELALVQSQSMREQAMQQARMTQDAIRAQEREVHVQLAELADRVSHAGIGLSHFSESVHVPAPWAGQDVADSVYRAARDLFNRGEWGLAAAAFRSLPQRYPNSNYASEAGYYEAFSLYRIGGTPELRAALAALDAQRAKYPNARSRTEATNLTTRILGVLAERNDQQAAARLRTEAERQGATCDKEEQTVQAEAMNALSRSDAANVNELITRVLARTDECSVPLRRTAVFLVGNRRDAQAVTILAGVARNDPSNSVKVEAINVIGRLPSDEGAAVLEQLARVEDDQIQRAAVRALVRHPSARARQYIRTLVERDDISERVRSEALSAFNSDRATADDITWLRALYAKVQSPTLKSRTLSAIVRVGGPDVDQWLVTIASSETERSELRATAMRRIGASMSITDLSRLYDDATQQRFRREIISVLGKRKEDAATDKLINIIKNGTDPSLRTSAISAITGKDDPRATALLLEIINK